MGRKSGGQVGWSGQALRSHEPWSPGPETSSAWSGGRRRSGRRVPRRRRSWSCGGGGTSGPGRRGRGRRSRRGGGDLAPVQGQRGQPWVGRPVAGGPDHGRYAGAAQVQAGRGGARVKAGSGRLGSSSSAAAARDVGLDGAQEPLHPGLRRAGGGGQVIGEGSPTTVRGGEPAGQRSPRVRVSASRSTRWPRGPIAAATAPDGPTVRRASRRSSGRGCRSGASTTGCRGRGSGEGAGNAGRPR